MEDTIPFATYFVERLKQCGVKYVQGVPGDYNLELVSPLSQESGSVTNP
jgi:TPP-dependent 2-oxoacid decarboxylase